jgi:hypothetical protein
MSTFANSTLTYLHLGLAYNLHFCGCCSANLNSSCNLFYFILQIASTYVKASGFFILKVKFSSWLIYLNLQIVTHNVMYSQNASPQGLVHRIWNQKVNIIRFENASASSVIAICG